VPLGNTNATVIMLADPKQSLDIQSSADGLVIDVPKEAPDADATVILLNPDGSLKLLGGN
ncbi:MAG TPA: hypothetical protein VGI75_06650, partial [Pirellulales bacterium]|jgi:hypothetical protein